MGAFAWYAQATDTTTAKKLSPIAGRQAKATEKLDDKVKWFLDYCSTHLNATIRFMASDTILALHSDGSHLSEADSKSRASGHFYLTNKDGRDTNNGAILALSKIIKHVMGSASETEMASLFYNCKANIPLRIALGEMGRPQTKTTAVTDNSTAEGLINETMVPNRAKQYDFRTNWLKCREVQEQFDIIWKKGRSTEQTTTLNTTLLMYTRKRGEYLYAPRSYCVHSLLVRVC